MHTSLRMRQYQQQALASASPQQLIARLYDLGIAACHREDRIKLRSVLVELISSLDFERGGEIADRLHMIYEFCLHQSNVGPLDAVCELLVELRNAWRDGVMATATRPTPSFAV
ncbi:MAG: flagellar export chaperone FliS [Bacteroidota bacterium]